MNYLSKIRGKFFLLLVLSFFTFTNCNLKVKSANDLILLDSTKNKDPFKQAQERIKEQDTIWISSVGDLMCHSAELSEAVKSKGEYDFTPFFSIIKPFIEAPNLAFGNFETVTAGSDKSFTGYPTFNSPDEFAFACKDAGFDVLTTANNHCLDRGFYGIERTVKVLNDLGAYQTGTFASEEQSNEILIVNEKGIRIGILAYTFSTNGINPPSDKKFCVNYINTAKMKEDIEAAKSLGCDKIVVCVHWGEEYQRTPNSGQKKIADDLFEYGADIIFGSHPHVIQPMETRTISDNNGVSKKVFIIYSMGNFISNQRKKYTDCGVIVNVQIIRNNTTKQTFINKITYIPTYVSTSSGGFKIIPVQESIYAVNNKITDSPYYFPSDYNHLQEIWEETTNHLTNESCEIYPGELDMK